MTHKVYDFLKRKKLKDIDEIVNKVGRLSAIEISDLCEGISDAISGRDLRNSKSVKDSPFNFTATPFTVGFDGPCVEWRCRLAQASEFARFAILYADTVALPNEFDQFIGLKNISDQKLDFLKFDLIGNILVMWQLEDIVSSGIGVFVPNSISLCEEHSNEFKNIWGEMKGNMEQAAVKLQGPIAAKVNMSVTATADGITYEAELPDELFLEDLYVTANPEEPPKWFTKTKKFQNSLSNGKSIKLTKREVERFGIVEYALLRLVPWARMYMFSRMFMESKYLTNRPTDAIIMDETLLDKKLRRASKNIQDYIPLKMPIIMGTATKDLLRVRQQDYQAFINYRASISAIENEFRNGREFTEKDAREFYEDIVYPSLQKLESKTENLKRDLRSTTAKKIIVASTFAGLGIALGFVPYDMAKVLQVIGACEVINAAVDIWKSIDTPSDIRNEPFYFLWKVNKHRAK